jgi:hypothetical protein
LRRSGRLSTILSNSLQSASGSTDKLG